MHVGAGCLMARDKDFCGPAPFAVVRDGEGWTLIMRPNRHIAWFETQAEAINLAYKRWPWWL